MIRANIPSKRSIPSTSAAASAQAQAESVDCETDSIERMSKARRFRHFSAGGEKVTSLDADEGGLRVEDDEDHDEYGDDGHAREDEAEDFLNGLAKELLMRRESGGDESVGMDEAG